MNIDFWMVGRIDEIANLHLFHLARELRVIVGHADLFNRQGLQIVPHMVVLFGNFLQFGRKLLHLQRAAPLARQIKVFSGEGK